MKKYLLPILLVFPFTVKAQWVSIPDTIFAKSLNASGYAACLQGNSTVGWQMDTTCPAVVNATRISFVGGQFAIDFTGIQYFDNLDTFICYNGPHTTLAPLPGNLTYLDCHSNQLTSLPALPASLTNLICYNNQQLTTLPTLPGSLTRLICYNDQLATLPSLPGSLTYLECQQNNLALLPSLPVSLTVLVCNSNQLTTLPTLPVALDTLICNGNQLTALSALPVSLTYLECVTNQLTSLPALPGSLITLYCYENQLTALPTLPVSLSKLLCGANPITSLPSLPGSLTVLNCDGCQLTFIPALPGNLTGLYCESNQLISLPTLPASLSTLRCSNNQLTTIPELPDSLFNFTCSYNPNLYCLPELKTIRYFTFSNTGIDCLPNFPQGNVSSTPDISFFPLCNVLNSHGCAVRSDISGRVYYDANQNCITDTSETRLGNIKVELRSGGNLVQQTVTNLFGQYEFVTGSSGVYTVSLDTTNLPFEIICPLGNLITDTVVANDTLQQNDDFGLRCRVDLMARGVYGRFRPGRTDQLNINLGDAGSFYGINCADSVNGTVTVTITGPAHYVAPAFGALSPNVINGNTITYNIADFGIVDFFHSFNIVVQTDTTANIGNTVCITVTVTPANGDYNSANDTLTICFVVVGSYDPNDKQVYPLSDVDVNGEYWLTYTVNFQNTGTDTAIDIYITDALDADLNPSTFQLLSYSHQPIVQIMDNALRFNFPNIMLVDSYANEPLSHGYVQYKIKIKDGKPVGTVINNTAKIYFDFNAPVITNTTTNTITINTAMPSAIANPQFAIYPNPATNTLHINTNLTGAVQYQIYNALGALVQTNKTTAPNFTTDISSLASGIYFLKLKTETAEAVTRFIKQ